MNSTFVPLAVTHPSVATATWTKVSAVDGKQRKYLKVSNESQSVVWRVCRVPAGAAAPTAAGDGEPLNYGASGNHGEVIEETLVLSRSDVYAYQASGGPLTTLAVTEGR